MNLTETFSLAFSALWAHKLRSFLTLLGMIIGVMAFMIVLSLVQGLSSYIDEKIAKIGSNSFTVTRFSFDDFKDTDTRAAAQRRNKELTLDELEFIRERAQIIDKIGAKSSSLSTEIKYENNSVSGVRVFGAEAVIADIDKLDIADGRYFTEAENSGAVRVAYIGADIESKLFPYGSALDREIDVRGIPYRVIGVQTSQGKVFGQPMDSFVQIPFKTYASDFGGTYNQAASFAATAKSDQLLGDAVEEVRTLLRIKRKLAAGEKDNFGIFTPDAISGIKDRLLGPVFLVVLTVPAIALIVGAIVIMNIMLVAVSERTKEIGIRKSLGARRKDILRQFIIEAAMLAATGGIIGLILAEISGYIVTILVFQTRIPFWSIILSIGVSGLVGVAAGFFPAWKAAQLDPIEALRAE